MKKISLIVAILLLAVSGAFAQFALRLKPEDVKAFKGKKLYVTLLEIDEKTKSQKKYKKHPEELKKLIEENEEYNNKIKNAIEKMWTYSSKIEYTTRKTLKELKKSKTNDAYIDIRYIVSAAKSKTTGVELRYPLYSFTFGTFKAKSLAVITSNSAFLYDYEYFIIFSDLINIIKVGETQNVSQGVLLDEFNKNKKQIA